VIALEKDFRKLFEDCKDRGGFDDEIFRCEGRVRGEYRRAYSGRLWQMADEVHKFLSHLDLKHEKEVLSEYPDLAKIANEFGVIENLRIFK